MVLRQMYNPFEETVTFELERQEESWLAVGFGTQMVGTTAVVGLPDDTADPVQKLFLGGKNLSAIQPRDSRDLENTSLEQNGGRTILRFTQPLPADQANGLVDLVVAAGSGNAFGYHDYRFSIAVELDACLVVDNQVATPAPVASAPTPLAVEGPAPAPATLAPTPLAPAPSTPAAPTQAVPLALDCSFQGETNLPSDMKLRQIYNPLDKTISFEVEREKQSWLAVGFGTQMIGTTAIVGLPNDVNEPIQKIFLGGKDPAAFKKLNTFDLQNASLEQDTTRTVLRFTQPFDEGESVDQLSLVVAAGFNNEFGYHEDRFAITVDMDVCLQGAAAIGPFQDPTPAPTALDCGFRSETELPSNIVLRQITNPREGTVTIEVTREKQSWLAVGFGDQMVGTTAIVGLPNDGEVQKIFLGGKDPAAFEQRDTSALIDATIEQTETQTILRFTQPLEQDGVAVAATGPQDIVVAAGSGNDFGYHEVRFAITVDMEACAVFKNGTVNAIADAPAAAPSEPVSPAPTFDPDQELDCTLFSQLELDAGVSIKEVVNPIEQTVTIEMTYESSQGAWLGISLSSNGFMVGNRAVIGLPEEPVGPNNPALYELNGKAASAVTRLPDDQQVLTSTNLVQDGSRTVMTFTQPLSAEGQRAISATAENQAIFAVGRGNSFSDGLHASFGSFTLSLTQCLKPGEEGSITVGVADVGNNEKPNKELWILHGILMAIGWGLFVPLAIGASLTRNLFPKEGGLWFKIHRGLNSFAMICILIGFLLAFILIQDATAPGADARHFRDEQHKKLGLVIVIFALLQALSGFLRPHAPHAPAKDNSQNDSATDNGDVAAYASEFVDDVAERHTQQAPETAAPVEEVKKTLARRVFEYQHRILGTIVLLASWRNIQSGLELFADRFLDAKDGSNIYWALQFILMTGILGATAYAKTRKQNN